MFLSDFGSASPTGWETHWGAPTCASSSSLALHSAPHPSSRMMGGPRGHNSPSSFTPLTCQDSPGGRALREDWRALEEAWTLDCDSSRLVGKRAGEGRGSGPEGMPSGLSREGPELGSAPSVPSSRGTVPWVALAGPGLADYQGTGLGQCLHHTGLLLPPVQGTAQDDHPAAFQHHHQRLLSDAGKGTR